MKYFALYNEELYYITECPTYESREEAESAAAGKCRRHKVVEIDSIKPCNPCAIYDCCLHCARCSATVEKRKIACQ